MAKEKNSVLIRIHPEFDRLLSGIKAKNLLRYKKISPSRITLAITRQFKNSPNLLKELEEAKLKWKESGAGD